MLKELHIKNIILIKEIKIDFSDGLSVFTGETGAGKTILLESLSWVLGARGSFSNIRHNEDTAEVIAIFTNITNEAIKLLNENSIIYDDELIIRRVMARDGKSKNFINNIPSSASFLKEIGTILLDIHGQFDNQKLLNQSFHRSILDNFLDNKNILAEVEILYLDYKNTHTKLQNKKNEILTLSKEKEYLEYSLNELKILQNKYGNSIFSEYNTLLNAKALLSNSQKIKQQFALVNKYLYDGNILNDINKGLKNLETLSKTIDDNSIVEIIQKIELAHSTLYEAIDSLSAIEQSLNFNEYEVDKIEEKIHSLKDIANKHRTIPTDLENLYTSIQNKVDSIIFYDKNIEKDEQELQNKHNLYLNKAKQLSTLRKGAANKLNLSINNELQFLKLSNAEFLTEVTNAEESSLGYDSVAFKVRTNKGTDFGYLNKIASGGEMARFMLALKIVLSSVDSIQTIILDEIDIGVGGEVAEAIGKRLLVLAQNLQTVIVTHSHQVASKAQHHYKVSKTNNLNSSELLESKVTLLSYAERVEEIARMISGEQISNEARATAINLLSI